MNGEPFIKLPDPQVDEIEPYVQSLRSIPKSGMHNPLKNPERYAFRVYIQQMRHITFDPTVKLYFLKHLARTPALPEEASQAWTNVR